MSELLIYSLALLTIPGVYLADWAGQRIMRLALTETGRPTGTTVDLENTVTSTAAAKKIKPGIEHAQAA